MMFFAVYVMLFLTKRASIQRMHEKALAGAGAHALAMLVSFARVRLVCAQSSRSSFVSNDETIGISHIGSSYCREYNWYSNRIPIFSFHKQRK